MLVIAPPFAAGTAVVYLAEQLGRRLEWTPRPPASGSPPTGHAAHPLGQPRPPTTGVSDQHRRAPANPLRRLRPL